MDNDIIEFHVKENDIATYYSLAYDSARVLQKLGANRFEAVCEEAHFFLESVAYHAFMVNSYHMSIVTTDSKIEKDAISKGLYAGNSWRPDVLAAVFEFDALLVCVRSLFDRLLQVLKTPLNQNLPKSITDFSKKHQQLFQEPLAANLISSWVAWGKSAKDYRDCLLHYWTFVQGLNVILIGEGRQLLIPDNPNANSPLGFIYQKKITLVDYALDLNKKCQELANVIFKQIFEMLITEEFGKKARIQYWREIPHVDSKQVKGNHRINLIPGIGIDQQGKAIRFQRVLESKNGEIILTDYVPEEWLKQYEDGRELTSNESYTATTEYHIALKRMVDKEQKRRKRK